MMTFKTPLILCALGALALAGCTDPNSPNAGQNPRTMNGALAGALIGGALAGASADDNKLDKALAGALVGGAAGAVTGNILDRQAADLRNNVGNQVGIVNTGSELVVTLPQDILFATDSANLRPDLVRDLNAVASNLQQYPNSTIQIVGHTDDQGTNAYNQDLSERRARAVASTLVSYGVPSGRVVALGRGEDQPIASNASDSGRAQNRRVEIIIRPTR